MGVSATNRKFLVTVVTCVLAVNLSAYSSTTVAQLPDNAETEEVMLDIESRDGFSIREISDDLFDRMKNGNTYKTDCIVPREDLR